MTGREPGHAEKLRRNLPEAARKITEVTVDNPLQVALVIAGIIVAAKAARRLVRPDNVAEAAALALLLQVGAPWVTGQLLDRGILKLRVRDAEGRLVPLLPGKVITGDGDAAEPPGS